MYTLTINFQWQYIIVQEDTSSKELCPLKHWSHIVLIHLPGQLVMIMVLTFHVWFMKSIHTIYGIVFYVITCVATILKLHTRQDGKKCSQIINFTIINIFLIKFMSLAWKRHFSIREGKKNLNYQYSLIFNLLYAVPNK